MTLKGKNRYTFVFSICFLGISVFFLVYSLISLNFVFNENYFFGFFKNEFTQSSWTMLFSGICLLIYIPLVSFYIYSHFLKTPSTEVIYFMLFLLGCATQLARGFVALETIQNTLPEFLVVLGRTFFWGQFLSFASLFTGAVAGTPDQRIYVEQNIFILLIFSLTLANLVPVNTTSITNSFLIEVGMKGFLTLFCVISAVLTFLTYMIKAWQSEEKKYFMLGFDTIAMQAGFVLLNSIGILFAAVIGGVLLVGGTFAYLRHLHQLYV